MTALSVRATVRPGDVDMSGEGNDDNNDKPKSVLVTPPGGPRSADSIHAVRPGEVLRRGPDGSFGVSPTAWSLRLERAGPRCPRHRRPGVPGRYQSRSSGQVKCLQAKLTRRS